MDIADICRTFHPNTKEQTFFSAVNEIIKTQYNQNYETPKSRY